ncbi:MAG: hypothetical protein ABIY37_13685, partial [Devosia sp.]
MAQPLVSRIGASPLWRAGLASAFILGLAGFAAGVIPQACRSGFVICQAQALAPLDGTILPEPKPAGEQLAVVEVMPVAQTTEAVAAIDTAMLAQQPAALTKNDLIAQTFAALDVEMVSTPGELTARKVRTVSIGPDGMPVLEPAPTQVAQTSLEQAPVAVELEVAEAEVPDVSEPLTEAPVAEEEPTASAYAPVRGGNAVIGRQGANVRSAPQTRASDVMF